jgi:hypothetical protein
MIVLLFNTCAHHSLAARLHADDCPMVRMARRGSGVIRTDNPSQEDIDNLNEREFPVKRCKCLNAHRKGTT